VIQLVVITDGRRDCIARTIPSALDNLCGPITSRLIYDDSGDEANLDWLADQYEPHGFTVIGTHQRRGFGGAIRYLWREWLGPERFVFWLEDDFTFNRPVPLAAMCETLERYPYLAQLVLRRQPWNADERAAGGIVEQHPDDYTEHHHHDLAWLEHRRFWSTNPSMFRTDVCAAGWPDTQQSEGMFTHRLLADGIPGTTPEDVRFAFWGARDSGEWVTHIGHERVGTGY
jgi:hypothetical protein